MNEIICPFCGASVSSFTPPDGGLLRCPECDAEFSVLPPKRRKKRNTLPDDHPAKIAERRRQKREEWKRRWRENRERLLFWGKLTAILVVTFFFVILIIRGFASWGEAMQEEEEYVALASDIREAIRSRLIKVRDINSPSFAPSVRISNLKLQAEEDEGRVPFSVRVMIDDSADKRYTLEGTLKRNTGDWVIPEVPIDELKAQTEELPDGTVVELAEPKPARFEGNISEDIAGSTPRMFLVILLFFVGLAAMMAIKRYALR